MYRIFNIILWLAIGMLAAACAEAAPQVPLTEPATIPPPLPLAPSQTTAPMPATPTRSTPHEKQPLQPWDPAPGDEALLRGEVFIEKQGIEIQPAPQTGYLLNVSGALPTPCHELRAQISPPDAQNRLQMQLYSLAAPGKICVQVLKPFDAKIPLPDLPQGRYTLLVNGKAAGEFGP